MLMIARKVNERIFAGDVEIVVMSITGKIVRLGFRAPKSVKIWRAELMDGLDNGPIPTAWGNVEKEPAA